MDQLSDIKKDASFLSIRGVRAANTPARVDMELYFEALGNRYDSETNPQGDFPMNVAENHLCWEMLKQKIQQITREQEIPDWVAGYGDPVGVASFREAVAAFMSKFFTQQPIGAETLACSSGATGVIEMTALLLANPNDTVVIPAPAYPVYTADMGMIPGLKRFDLQTYHELAELRDGVPLGIETLAEVKASIESAGSRFAMLVLTSPDNPTGMIYSEDQYRTLADWCIREEIHLIVNEIYGMSRINIGDERIKSNYWNPMPFYSFGKLMHAYQSPFLHHWYAFSKDFGISGFRIGVLHSYNLQLISAFRNAGLGRMISNYTQWVMQEVLSDESFLEEFFEKQSKALTEAFCRVKLAMEEVGVKVNPCYGSLFAWIDLSHLLAEQSLQGETALWKEVYRVTGILMTPADGFGHSKRGMFRLVITSLSSQALSVAMDRFKSFIRSKSLK